MRRISAFTLAEVLITLSIIGIVAAITIPTLINNYQKRQYVTSLKKAYTTLAQAFSQFSTENNCVNNLKCTGFFEEDSSASTAAFGAALTKYIKTSKICGEGLGCFPANAAYNYDGSDVQAFDADADGAYKFISTDGMSYSIHPTQCSEPGVDAFIYCGDVIIDVNGPNKKPNIVGRDIFNFFIAGDTGSFLIPYGSSKVDSWQDVDSGCVDTCFNGYYCAGRVMEENWEMNY